MYILKKREVEFRDGSKGFIDGEDILFSIQQIHSCLGHAGAQITYNHASDWFKCNGLKSICEFACKNCVCQYIKPIVGSAAYVGSLSKLAKSANDIIFVDTWDAGVDGNLGRYSKIRKCQTRIDGFTGRISGSIVISNDSSNHWQLFRKDHIDLFGRPRVIFTVRSIKK